MTKRITQADIHSQAERTGQSVEQVLELVLMEALIRRAALVGGPFMLKGSLITRQYLDGPARDSERLSRDVDWVCTEPFDVEDTREQLDDWAQAVTTVPMDDGVRFQPFSENQFWRMIDYAMDDDFPTVSTDIDAWLIDGESQAPAPNKTRFLMDVSFNLKLDPPPVALRYQPVFGEAFELPSTCALELQIAWKLHQCLIRPRFKDLLDLMWLVPRNSIDADAVGRALRAECLTDRADIERLCYLLNGNFGRHPAFAGNAADKPRGSAAGRFRPTLAQAWDYWRHGRERAKDGEWTLVATFGDPAEACVGRVERLPDGVEEFLAQLHEALVGLVTHLLPAPSSSWVDRLLRR